MIFFLIHFCHVLRSSIAEIRLLRNSDGDVFFPHFSDMILKTYVNIGCSISIRQMFWSDDDMLLKDHNGQKENSGNKDITNAII